MGLAKLFLGHDCSEKWAPVFKLVNSKRTRLLVITFNLHFHHFFEKPLWDPEKGNLIWLCSPPLLLIGNIIPILKRKISTDSANNINNICSQENLGFLTQETGLEAYKG